MATKQRLVYGSTVEWGTDGSTWANVAEVKSLAVPEVQQDYQDVTNLDSPNGYREYIPGLKDAGEIAVNCGYTSDVYDTAFDYQTNGTLVYFQVTLPMETGQSVSGDVFDFTAYVRPTLETNDVGEPIGMVLNLRISGAPGFTKGS